MIDKLIDDILKLHSNDIIKLNYSHVSSKISSQESKFNDMIPSITTDLPISVVIQISEKNGKVTAIQEIGIVEYDVTDSDDFPIHRHEYIDISYIYKGKLEQIFLGELEVFTEGDFVIYDKNFPHKDILKKHDSIVISIRCSDKYFNSLFMDNVFNTDIYQFIQKALSLQKKNNSFLHYICTEKNEEIEELLTQIILEDFEKKPGFDYILRGLIARTFSSIKKNYMFNLKNSVFNATTKISFFQIENFIQNNLADISINMLKNEFFFNASYYSEIIKNYTGLTYTQFVQKLRLERAVDLLDNSNSSIQNICNEVGYANKLHFYNLFKKEFGITPRVYRQRSTK